MKQVIIERIVEEMNKVKSSFPSVYSQQDVHTILCRLYNFVNEQEEQKTEFDLQAIEKVWKGLDEHLKNNFESEFDAGWIVDKDSATFELHGNEISLDDVQVDVNQIESDVRTFIQYYFAKEYSIDLHP